MALHSQLQKFDSKYQEGCQALLKVSISVLSIPDFVQVSVDLLQKLKHIVYTKEQVVRVRSLSSIKVVLGFPLGSSKHIKHIVLFSLLLIMVPIYLPVYKVSLLLVGGVYTIVKLVQVINFVRGVIARTVASSRVVTT